MRRTFLGTAAFLFVAAAAAEPPTLPAPDKAGSSSGYGSYDYRRLVGTTTVQKALGFTADQRRAAIDVGNVTAKALNEAMKAKELNDLSAVERTKKRIEIREKYEAEYQAGLRQHLTPDQLARLGQIRLQSDAPGSMLWPDVAGKLKLTAEQKSKVEKIARFLAADRLAVYQKEIKGTGDRDMLLKVEAKQRELGEKANTEALAVLDAAQKKTWKELTGDPFDLANLGVSGVGKD